jgi:fatty-acyl-CoA synthase
MSTIRLAEGKSTVNAFEWAPVRTMGDMLDERAASHGDRDAVVFPDERVTFRELADRADTAARALIAMGVDYRDRVGILLPNCVDSLVYLFAAMKIGAVPVPINGRFKETELRQVVTHSGMCVLVSVTAFADVIGRALADPTPELRKVVLLDETNVDAPEEDVQRRQRFVRLRDAAVIVYTSGTTAAPKGAMISHEAFSKVADGIAHDRFHLTPEDRIWTALPLCHIGGIAFAIASIYAGVPYCHTGQFSPAAALRQLERERCTIALAGFETIWLPVLNAPEFADTCLDALRIVMVVGVPARLRSMQDKVPHATQVACFGQTEAGSFLSLNLLTDSYEERATTGGLPLPGMQARVVHPDTGADLLPGTPGELLYRGSNMFDGYFRDPELTAEVIDADGWFHSGDVATVDNDGRVTFVGRLKDMLKVGGENVAAAEVEDFLVRHPAVGMVQVVAAPDEHYVEVPAAFIELKPGATATEEEIIEFCLGRIATFRVPRYVRFVTEWPMSGTKVKKYVLRERIAAEMRAADITTAPKLRSRV